MKYFTVEQKILYYQNRIMKDCARLDKLQLAFDKDPVIAERRNLELYNEASARQVTKEQDFNERLTEQLLEARARKPA